MKKLRLAFAPLLILPDTPASAAPDDTVAWSLVEGLTTEVGQRLAGTEAEARARDWGMKKLKALGFKNVAVEPFPMKTWIRGIETAELTAPYPQRLAIAALGGSGATPEAGLKGNIVVFPTFADFKAAPDDAVKGKIVYVGHTMKATQDGSSYGYFGVLRRSGPNLAARRGAAAFLIRSIGTDNHRVPHTGLTNWEAGVEPIPAAAVSNPDADLIERANARNPGGLQLALVLTPKFVGEQLSGNLIGEIPGSDPDAGVIVIGGHLDSWDLGTGAIDDGAGIAITTAAAKAILDSGKKPRRTIRIVWWGAEEEGGLGGAAYFAKHKGERHALAGESDFGADRVWRFQTKLPTAAAPLAARLASALAPLGIAAGAQAEDGGTDVGPLVAAGVPVIALGQDGTRYFDIHHTADDTLDKIDPKQLAQNVEAWRIMLETAANAPEDLMAGRGQ